MRKKIYPLIANIKKSISINFLERILIPTGFFIQISENTKYSFFLKEKFIESIYVIHLKKHKKYPLYQEIQIIVLNVFFKNMIIKPREKLVILYIMKNIQVKWKKSYTLNLSIRGSNSFGSTGI